MTQTMPSSASTVAEPAADVRRRPAPSRTAEWAGWGFVALSVLAQFGLFRQFALREVVWSYPANFDQLAYLEQSYQTYERILEHGLVTGLKAGLGFGPSAVPLNAAGATLHPQAAVLYLMAGPSRFTAISLNFIYFAILQIVLVWSVRWLTGTWSAAFVALGLLLTCLTGFFVAGGRFDFRLDFIAFCLFGIFISLVIRSNVFRDWRWSAVAGLGGAALGAFRFITLSYLLSVFVLLLAFLVLQWLYRLKDPPGRETAQQRTKGLLIAGVVIIVIAGPLLWHHWGAIESYYVAGHLKHGEKELRAAETGTTALRESLEFYPSHLVEDHLGPVFKWTGALVLVTAALIGAAGLIFSRVPRRWRPDSGSDFAPAICFVALCLIVPMAVLTADTAKAAQVAGIMVAPTVWLVVVVAVWLLRVRREERTTPAVRYGLAAIAVIAMAASLWTQFTQYTRRTYMSEDRAEVEKLIGMYDRMADECRELGWTAPAVAWDCNVDYLYQKNLSIVGYERHGVLLAAGASLGRLEAYPLDELYERLRRSDFALITRRTGPLPPYQYPFDVQMEQLHPQLMDWCRKNMVELEQFHVFDRDVTLFIRPAARVQLLAWARFVGKEK